MRSFCKMGTPAALTLLEMILAMAMMAIIFAVIVPLFRPMLSSWDSKAGAAEALQNGRVLIDHLKYNLSKAVRISDVSGSAVTSGYIEYEDNDGNTCRYDVASSYVEFGVVGSLSDLAGPVSQLQFTCYDACDFNTPITDVNSIRFVKVETTLTNSEALGQDKSFIAQAYLRANASSGGVGTSNFGNENVEAEELTGKNFQYATQATLSEDGTVTSISAHVKGLVTKLMRYALYTDSSGEPGTLVVESVAEAIGLNEYHWHETAVTPTALSAGTYWLALAFEFKNMYVAQSAAGLGQTRHRNNNAVANGFLASWGASDVSNTRRLSIYATYTPSGGGGQILP